MRRHPSAIAVLGPAAFACASTLARAEPTLAPCDGPGSPAGLAAVVEPWGDASRAYANGAIRIVHVDTGGEPVCCSSHLAILFPSPSDGPSFRQCTVLSDGPDHRGFLDVSLGGVASSYDPERGLRLSVPVERYDGVQGADPSRAGTIGLRVNQATGTVVIE